MGGLSRQDPGHLRKISSWQIGKPSWETGDMHDADGICWCLMAAHSRASISVVNNIRLHASCSSAHTAPFVYADDGIMFLQVVSCCQENLRQNRPAMRTALAPQGKNLSFVVMQAQLLAQQRVAPRYLITRSPHAGESSHQEGEMD